MAYTLNSASDSRGDEAQYVARFNANLPAITAYKRQHGGDWEGAYGAVIGHPWPAGRSVKVTNGRGEMTKDRTVKSVLGKYVAPIAAGVAAPFALPALVGGGGAAAGAAGAGTGAGTGAGGLTAGGLLPATSLSSGSAALGGGLGFGAGLPSGVATTLGSAGAGFGTGAALRGGGAAAGGSHLMDWIKTGLAGTAAVGGAVHARQQQSQQNQTMDELRKLLALQGQRMELQNPLFEAITKLAMNRLPISATTGGAGTGAGVDSLTQVLDRLRQGGM